ncbi:MAG: hypothetical protein ACI8RP_002149, partial [Urechidicola sp.]
SINAKINVFLHAKELEILKGIKIRTIANNLYI